MTTTKGDPHTAGRPDYHDYVIKNGRLIGRFEEMYRDCEDPWDQSQPEHNQFSIPRLAAVAMLKQRGVRSVVEWGAGLGYFTEMLAGAGFDVTGVDVSPTAVARAKERRPDLAFEVDRVERAADRPADAIIFAQLTWFILPQLRAIFDSLLRNRPARFFVLIQTFYPPGVQRYGTEYFTTLDEYVRYCPLRLLQKVVVQEGDAQAVTEACAIFAIEPKG
jgi:SAM-dependent methyltransferase